MVAVSTVKDESLADSPTSVLEDEVCVTFCLSLYCLTFLCLVIFYGQFCFCSFIVVLFYLLISEFFSFLYTLELVFQGFILLYKIFYLWFLLLLLFLPHVCIW